MMWFFRWLTSFFVTQNQHRSQKVEEKRIKCVPLVLEGETIIDIQSTDPFLPYDDLITESISEQSVMSWWSSQVYVKPVPETVVHYRENIKATHQSSSHSFYEMFKFAYANHGEIVLTPEDVWTCISHQFSKYIEANSEALRSRFVSHAGNKVLVVSMKPCDNFYEVFMERVVTEIREHSVNDICSKLAYDFSTSTTFDQTMGHLSTMSAMKSYFSYGFRCLCGLSRVHFTGTLQDWQKLREKTETFVNTYHLESNSLYFSSLKEWWSHIDIILSEFIETYQGNVNVTFWNQVLDIHRPMSSGVTTEIHGWIVKLISNNNNMIQESDIRDTNFDVDVVGQFNGPKETNLKIVGGFSGLMINDKTIRPHRSYAIIDMTLSECEREKMEKWKIECSDLNTKLSIINSRLQKIQSVNENEYYQLINQQIEIRNQLSMKKKMYREFILSQVDDNNEYRKNQTI